jgi:hypothetical protein
MKKRWKRGRWPRIEWRWLRRDRCKQKSSTHKLRIYRRVATVEKKVAMEEAR